MTKRSRAVIYARVSKDEPGSTSLDDQIRDCYALADRRGLDVVAVYREREGTSAFRVGVRRPEWDRLLEEVQPNTVVLAWELSRLTRRGAEQAGPVLAHLEGIGATVVTVADGIDTGRDTSELTWSVRAAIAKDESARISARSRRGLASRRRAGLHHGRAPYGLRKRDGRLERDPDTFPAARGIAERALRGESVYAIVRDLNANGATWAYSSLRRWLRSPGIAGYASASRRDRSGRYSDATELATDDEGNPIEVGEGVITLSEWRRIQARLDERTTVLVGRSSGRRGVAALLSGIAVCAQCGGPMSGTGGTAEDGPKLYGCSRRTKRASTCERAYVSRKHADYTVTEAFIGGLAALEPGDPLHVVVAEAWTRRVDPETAAQGDRAREQLTAAEEAIRRLDDDRADGLLEREAYARQRERLARRRDAAARSLEAAERTVADISPLLDPEIMREAWEAATLVERRDLLALAIERVVIHPTAVRGKFDPRRVDVVWRTD